MKSASWCVLFAGVVASACGSSTPAAPSTPTITGLAVNTPFTAFPTGFFVNYTATASLSNGTTTDVTSSAVWASSNPSVAAVDNTGKLSANARGTISLTATYQGRTASQPITIVEYFGGKWSGTYVMQKCDQSGVFISAGWCRGLGGVGSTLPISLELTQGGAGAVAITGTASLGSLAGNISGGVTDDGHLNIGGTYSITSSGYTFQITFGGWNTSLVSSTQMVGGWANSVAAVGAAGNAYMESLVITLAQTSRTATAGRWSGARLKADSLFAPVEYRFATLEEMFSRLTQR